MAFSIVFVILVTFAGLAWLLGGVLQFLNLRKQERLMEGLWLLNLRNLPPSERDRLPPIRSEQVRSWRF